MGQCQTDSHALLTAVFPFVEPFEEMGQILLWNSFPVILKDQLGKHRVFPACYPNFSTGRCVLHTVFDDVFHRLCRPLQIPGESSLPGNIRLKINFLQFHGNLHRSRGLLYQFPQGITLLFKNHRICIQFGEFQQHINEPLHFSKKPAHLSIVFLPLFFRRTFALPHGQKQVHGGQWRLKLMGQICQRVCQISFIMTQPPVLFPQPNDHFIDLAL